MPSSSLIGSIRKKMNELKDTRELMIIWIVVLIIHGAIVFLGPLISISFPLLSRNWGVNNISYYSLPWIILFYVVRIVIGIPFINERFYFSLAHILSSKPFQILHSERSKKTIFIIIGIVSIAIFHLIQIKYNFLGDMDLRVKQTLNQQFLGTEALTMYVMYQIYGIWNSIGEATGLQAFQWVSYLSGGIFIVLSLLLADELFQGYLQKTLFILFFVFSGTLQLFFGYVEVYCLPAISILLYLYISVLYIKGRVPEFVPVLVLLVSIGLHVMSVGLLPSLWVLLFYPRIER